MASKLTIKAIFKIFANELGDKARKVDEIIGFSPEGWKDKLYVYFKLDDSSSLYIVVDKKETAIEHAKSMYLHRPY